ncbi:hypothetical protein RUM44_008544 [Polyplax serrata]|uniref:Uncharacterized protein n=1 Tax=Polyplax serrata TaxID=468196 RepID=A0ABR1BCI6_POLSC
MMRHRLARTRGKSLEGGGENTEAPKKKEAAGHRAGWRRPRRLKRMGRLCLLSFFFFFCLSFDQIQKSFEFLKPEEKTGSLKFTSGNFTVGTSPLQPPEIKPAVKDPLSTPKEIPVGKRNKSTYLKKKEKTNVKNGKDDDDGSKG